MINNTPLYIDLLDYLERDGIASLSNNFDPNAFMTNYDELDTTSPLINNPTVDPTIPYIIPPLGGGDGPRQGLESLREDDDDVFDYEYDAYGIVDPFSIGVKSSPTIHEIGLAAADKERARLQEIARVEAFERQQKEAEQAAKDRAEKARQIEANRMQAANEQNETGGYQAGYDKDFMEGPQNDGNNNGGGSPGSSGPGGSDTMGSF